MNRNKRAKVNTLALATSYYALPSGVSARASKLKHRNTLDQKLLNEIRTNLKTLDTHLNAVRKSGVPVSKSTRNIMNEVKKIHSKNLTGASTKSLQVIKNKVNYLKDLRSITVSGNTRSLKRDRYYESIINKTANHFKDTTTQENAVKLAHELEDKTYHLYNKLVEEFGAWEKIKYKISDDIRTLLLIGKDDEEILEVMYKKLQNMYEEYGADLSHAKYTYFKE